MQLSSLTTEILAGVAICLCLLNWRLVRPWPLWMRLATSGLFFALLTAALTYSVGSPLQPAFNHDTLAEGFGQQAIAAAWWLLGARLLVEVVRGTHFSEGLAGEGRLPSDLIAGAVYLVAVLMIVSTVFDLPIRALVATSGIIAIVLGLALQSTLADVFSGIAVGIEHPYSIGDRISMDGTVEGVVTEINWRSLRILTDSNDVATIPNSLAAKSRIINRSTPTTQRGSSILIPCATTIQPDRVIELIHRAILLCPTILSRPPPAVALVRIGKRTNSYEVGFSVSDSSVLWTTKSTLFTEILRQFRSAGLDTPALAESGVKSEPEGATRPGRALGIALFKTLSDDQRRLLEERVRPRMLAPGEKLFAQGGQDGSLFVIVWGVLEISRALDALSFTIGRISAGDYVGEISLLTGAPYGATVTALTQSLALELRKDDLAPLIAEKAELMHALEASVRRAQAHVARAVAASVGAQTVPQAQLLSRISAYFRPHTH